MILRSLKPRTGLDNSATYHADKLRMIIMKEDSNMSKRSNEIMKNEVASPNRIIIIKSIK